jgi:hypothetical protein
MLLDKKGNRLFIGPSKRLVTEPGVDASLFSSRPPARAPTRSGARQEPHRLPARAAPAFRIRPASDRARPSCRPVAVRPPRVAPSIARTVLPPWTQPPRNAPRTRCSQAFQPLLQPFRGVPIERPASRNGTGSTSVTRSAVPLAFRQLGVDTQSTGRNAVQGRTAYSHQSKGLR